MLHSRLSYTFVILCMFLVQIYAVEENVDAPCLNGVGDETQDMCLSETILDSLNSLGYDTDRAILMYGKELEAILRKVLKSGIAGIIPPLDPLELNGVTDLSNLLPPMPGSLLLNSLVVENLTATGLSSFEVNQLGVSVTGGLGVVFDLSVSLDGHADFVDLDAIVADIIPFNGNGSLELGVNLRLNGNLTIRSDPGYILLNTIFAEIIFGEMSFDLSNMMNLGGTREAIIFNHVMGAATPDVLNVTVDSLIDSLLISIKSLVNGFLEDKKITPTQLVSCITGNGECPLDI